MSKAPSNLPSRGELVRLRGRAATGVLRTMDDESKWCRVEWDAGVEAPKYVHIYELERRSVTTCS